MVIDASALAALVYFEDEAPVVRSTMSGRRLFAPHLVDFEMASICLTKQRRDPDRSTLYATWLRNAQKLPIERLGTDFDRTLSVAARYRLSAYDASYLALALSLGEPLYTLDRRLAAAATAAGL